MNTKNLHQIFKNYIDRFEELNDAEHDETFKWWAASRFRKLMDEALHTDSKEVFVQKLSQIKSEDVVGTIIDGKMQPFAGLVRIASNNNFENADNVKELFQKLFEDDHNDFDQRERKIRDFLEGSEKLRLQYFPKYYTYKQTARSVSGYLFLYDPDHCYMYKAMQAKLFADCVEFYGDWGTGDQINLKEYYRMCDELVAEINNCPELIKTSDSRIALINRYTPPELASDRNRHILAYDIIYCTSVYHLYDGLKFKPITLEEKRRYQERMKRALELLEQYTQAENRYHQLEQARNYYNSILLPKTTVQHLKYGQGHIISRENGNIIVQFSSQETPIKLDFSHTLANRYLKFTDSLDDETAQQYRELFKDASSINDNLFRLKNELEQYRDILE